MAIFRKKRNLRFVDERLGELTATTKSNDLSKWCSWSGACTVAGQAKQTFVSLGGSPEGPHGYLLRQICDILDSFEQVLQRVSVELRERGAIEQFYLSTISVWDEVDEIIELQFSPIEQPTSKDYIDIVFCWPEDDEFLNHRIRVRPTHGQLTELMAEPK